MATSLALKDLAPNSSPLCTRHSLPLSSFCNTCEQLVCLQCSQASHKGHKCSDVDKESAARLSLLQTTASKALTLGQLLQRDVEIVKAERVRIQARAEEQKAVITAQEEQVCIFCI